MSDHATEEGTRRFTERFAKARAAGHFRLAGPLTLSTLGIGTYLGAADDETDARYTAAVERALQGGLNVVDTAINYRFQRSERAVGAALRNLTSAGSIARDEVVVCTKGGFVPFDVAPPSDRDAYLKRTYFDAGIMSPDELVDGCHCMAPSFLHDQVRRSLSNLGLSCVDVYYLHNPETQRAGLDDASFYERLRDAFGALEQEVADGHIGSYGAATWDGFRVSPDDPSFLDLGKVVQAARDAGGSDHHFRFIQAPVNLVMREAGFTPTQRHRGRRIPLLACARSHGLQVVASSSLMQGRLARGLPGHVHQRLPGFDKDSLLALQFVRSLEVATALVGMSRVEHVDENLELLSYRSRRLGA